MLYSEERSVREAGIEVSHVPSAAKAQRERINTTIFMANLLTVELCLIQLKYTYKKI